MRMRRSSCSLHCLRSRLGCLHDLLCSARGNIKIGFVLIGQSLRLRGWRAQPVRHPPPISEEKVLYPILACVCFFGGCLAGWSWFHPRIPNPVAHTAWLRAEDQELKTDRRTEAWHKAHWHSYTQPFLLCCLHSTSLDPVCKKQDQNAIEMCDQPIK